MKIMGWIHVSGWPTIAGVGRGELWTETFGGRIRGIPGTLARQRLSSLDRVPGKLLLDDEAS